MNLLYKCESSGGGGGGVGGGGGTFNTNRAVSKCLPKNRNQINYRANLKHNLTTIFSQL